MRLTGSAKSTQKRGAMAPRRTHYPQILFLEKKDPWGTVSGLESPLPFLGYLSHSVLYRISKCAHCKLCNNGMFAPFDEGCSLVLQQILRFYTLFWLTNLKIRFCFFVYIRLACCLCSSFHGRQLFLPALNSILVCQDLLPTIVFFLRVVYIGLSTLILFPTTLKGFCLKVVFAFNVFDYFPLWRTRGIRHLHVSHNAPYLLPKILHNLCFFISHGYYSRPKRNWKQCLCKREGRKRVGPVTPFVGYIAVLAYFGLHAKKFQTCKQRLFFTYLPIERRFRRDFDLEVRCKFCH